MRVSRVKDDTDAAVMCMHNKQDKPKEVKCLPDSRTRNAVTDRNHNKLSISGEGNIFVATRSWSGKVDQYGVGLILYLRISHVSSFILLCN